MAFEFHLSFQKLQEHQLNVSLSYWLHPLAALNSFFLLDDEYTGFLLHVLKIEMSSLLIFRKKRWAL